MAESARELRPEGVEAATRELRERLDQSWDKPVTASAVVRAYLAAVAGGRRTISRSRYHQLVGLLTVAQRHSRALDQIEKAAAEVLEEEPDRFGGYGHIGDALYARENDPEAEADDLLRRLEIVVGE